MCVCFSVRQIVQQRTKLQNYILKRVAPQGRRRVQQLAMDLVFRILKETGISCTVPVIRQKGSRLIEVFEVCIGNHDDTSQLKGYTRESLRCSVVYHVIQSENP